MKRKSRHWIAVLTAFALTLSMIPMTAVSFAEDAAGLVEEDGEYWIRTPEALDDFAAQVTAGNDFAGKVVNLDADITAGSDFAGAGVFNSSAANVKSFNGTLDGGGHTITLAINQTITGGVLTAGCAGLINDLGEAGIVKNLNVSGSVLGIHSATSGNMYVGGIAAYNRGTIQDCTVTAEVRAETPASGSLYVGGISGETKGLIKNSTVSGSVIGAYTTGSSIRIGGISGKMTAGATVDNCTYNGKTVAPESSNTAKLPYVGGITGEEASSSTTPSYIINCSVNGAAISGYYAGGIAGSASGRVLNCFSDASVTGSRYTGGITGGTSANTILRNTYFAGTFGESAVNVGGVFSSSSSKAIAQNNYVAASSVENITVGSNVFAYSISTSSSSATTLTDNATFDAAGNLTWQEGASAITPADAGGTALADTVAITDVTTLLSALQTWQMNSEEGAFASWKAGDPYPVFETGVVVEPPAQDLSGDGVIDNEDVKLLQKAVLGKSELTPEQLEAVDFNGDGKVTASDVLHMKKLAAGLI